MCVVEFSRYWQRKVTSFIFIRLKITLIASLQYNTPIQYGKQEFAPHRDKRPVQNFF